MQNYSKVFKADLFGLMFLSMKIGKRKTILWSGTKGRQKSCLFVGTDHLLIRKKIPQKTIQPFILLFIHLYISILMLNGLKRKPFSNPSPNTGLWRVYFSLVPYPSFHNHRQIFFAIPETFLPKSLIFFTICAEKVCYKVCNMYYKVCNMRYKVSNMCYKLCNKNFLIGQEKLSCG